MCGIIGFCGKSNILPLLLDGLERLEYRGYDSAGVALVNNSLQVYKTQGRLDNLRRAVAGINDSPYKRDKNTSGTGIGHTRWATHGTPSQKNAHPHLSRTGKFAVVHNGIIENHVAIKAFLQERSFPLISDTDTEVIGHLIEYYYRGDVIDALIKAAQRLHGSYALAVLSLDNPDVLYAMRKESPLVVGIKAKSTPQKHLTKKLKTAAKNDMQDKHYSGTYISKDDFTGSFLASDMSALLSYTRDFILPEAGEIAILTRESVNIINFNREPVNKPYFHVDWEEDAAQKNGFEHFMLKEIYEQPRATEYTLNELNKQLPSLNTLKYPRRLSLIACGSAYHAGLFGKYFIEKLCRIPVDCEMASEFRYKNPILEEGTLTIAISQSGETADTIAALAEAKKSTKTLSIVNVLGSTITRQSDEVIYTLAGPEIAVPTTKGYLSQVAALCKIGIHLRHSIERTALVQNQTAYAEYPQNTTIEQTELYESEFKNLPMEIKKLLEQKEIFQQLSTRFSSQQSAFFIGRGIDYAVAMEGALKLKEISYIHAQSYPAGELKHGTISLIEDGSLVVAVSTDPALAEKMANSIAEVRSRGAVVLAVTNSDTVATAADYSTRLPEGLNAPILAAVSLQLFSYYMALARGCDIDKPRNLAKSVTVE